MVLTADLLDASDLPRALAVIRQLVFHDTGARWRRPR